jgi:hypothetical protein
MADDDVILAPGELFRDADSFGKVKKKPAELRANLAEQAKLQHLIDRLLEWQRQLVHEEQTIRANAKMPAS